MKIPWGTIVHVAARVGSAVITGVPVTESLLKAIGDRSGADKKTAVLDLVRAELALAGGVVGKDLASDPAVLSASSALIDAYVHLHNMLAAKSAAGVGA